MIIKLINERIEALKIQNEKYIHHALKRELTNARIDELRRLKSELKKASKNE